MLNPQNPLDTQLIAASTLLLDTRSSDPSIKHREFDQLNPNRILPRHADIDYELADNTIQRMKAYKLYIIMSNAQDKVVSNWRHGVVAVEPSDSA